MSPIVTSAETADLLEALRRRRGQREPLPGIDEVVASRAHSPVALFDALEPGYDETPVEDEPEPDYDAPSLRGGRGRPPKGPLVDAVVGRDRVRSTHRGVIGPAPFRRRRRDG